MASPSAQSELGRKAFDFDLQGVDGRRYRLADVSTPNGTLVIVIFNHCPYVKAAIGRVVADVPKVQKLGVGAIALKPNDPGASSPPSPSAPPARTPARC